MKLTEAIAKQVDIVCANEDEKAQVVEILEGHHITLSRFCEPKNNWLCVFLFESGEYAVVVNCSGFYPTISATTFIQANKG